MPKPSEKIQHCIQSVEANKIFIQTYGAVPYTELPKRYFSFADTVSVYQHIPEQPDTRQQTHNTE